MQPIQRRFNEWVKPAYLGWASVIMGGLFRLRQYFSGRSLWRDEAGLALNIVERNFAGLLQPLGYEQGAPVGFLFLEKFLILVFGNHDQVMRLVPLLSGILSVYFFYRIAQVHIKGGLFATLLFAISWTLVYYSSELKQYSSDVMIALLLVFLASQCLRKEARWRDFLTLGIAGVIALWMSHPAAFVLAGVGLALFFAFITKRHPIPFQWLVILAAMWVVSFGLEYLISLRYLAASDYLMGYWKKAFMPLPPGGTRAWLVKTYESLLLTTLNRTDGIVSLLVLTLVPIGALSLLFRDRVTAIVMVSPFVLAMLASIAQKYPLRGRLILFLVPFVLFLLAEGLGAVYSLIAKWNGWVARLVYALPALVLFFLPVVGTWDMFLHPAVPENIKPVLQYAPFYGLENADILVGRNDPVKRVALRHFEEDVETTLRGKDRVWFIFSGIIDCGGCEGDMQSYYVDYLNRFGTMLEGAQGIGANGYLYKMNP
jgi:hypothetical protein